METSRYRSENLRSAMSAEYRVYDSGGNLDGIYSTSEDVGMWRKIEDVEVPNFHEQRNLGKTYFNDCLMWKEVLSASPMTGSVLYTNGSVLTGSICGLKTSLGCPDIPDPDYTDEEAESLTNAFANVTSATVQSLVILGELKETKEMLLKAVHRLFHLDKILTRWRLRKFGLRGTHKIDPKSWADLWLEFRYGWTPFVYDCRALAKALTKMNFPFRQTFRSYPYTHLAVENFPDHIWEDTKTKYVTTRRRFVDVYISSGVLCQQRPYGIPDTFGLTLIPEAMWDLTRLSFVLDWFFNIADTIAAWTPDTLYEAMGHWTTTKLSYTDVYTTTMTRKDGSSVNMSPYVHTKINTVYKRECLAQRDLFPNMRLQMSWKRYIDGVALSHDRIMKTLRKLRRR